jgi:hypothetical protein
MHVTRSAIPSWLAALALIAACGEVHPAVAQDTWNPFKPNAERERRPRTDERATPSPPMPRERPTVPASEQPQPRPLPRGGVERSELDPIIAADGSGLPLDLWRGLDLKTLEELLAGLELPPRSPAVHQLWRRLLLSTATAPTGAPDDEHFLALRLEALYRSGLLEDMDTVFKSIPAPGPVVESLRARRDIGLGHRETGCQTVKALAAPSSGLPGRLKGETQLLAGYCAAAAGDAHGAGLAAELAREEGVEAELPLAVLAAHAAGDKPRLVLPKRILLLDYRFLELLGPLDPARIFDKAEPALLVTLAGDARSDVRLQIAAAEAALRVNALSPAAVAKLYRSLSLSAKATADPTSQGADPLLRRALFFQAAEVARAPVQRARFLQAILEDARRSGSALQTASVVAPLMAGIHPSPEVAPYTPSLVEMALAAGEFVQARLWAESADLWPWVALIDIADPERRGGRLRSLGAMEDLAVRGRVGPEALHKLATVLDALDIEVPIQIWDAANRAPHPVGGYLPETGILADLAQSARRNDAGRTILLVMRTLGPGGPDGANLLALSDAIKALKHIGLDADARRLGLEALLPIWPRAMAN